LGSIRTLTPPVNFRRNREVVWNDASPGIALYPYDAIQTEAKAETLVALKNGSELQIRENSLVILSPELSHRSIDRAVVKNGSLKGKTKKELWLVANGTVLRMKPKKENQDAVLQLRVEEKKVSIKTENAIAVAHTNATTTEVIPEGMETKVTTSEVATDIAPSWAESLPAIEAPAPAVSSIERNVAAIPPATELQILSPKGNLETTDENIAVEGSLTQKGGKVWVNGDLAPVDSALHFRADLPLNYGANVVLIQMTSKEGTSTFRRYTVIRRKP
jgi:hypothetical protein